jgi:hypothetical protein
VICITGLSRPNTERDDDNDHDNLEIVKITLHSMYVLLTS